MTFLLTVCIRISCLFPLFAAPHSIELPVLAVIVHKSNPVQDITRNQLRKLMLGEVREWPNQNKVVIVHREPESMIFHAVLGKILHLTSLDYRRALLSAEFRGAQSLSVKILRSDDGAAKFVWNVPGAIAVIDATPAIAHSSRVKIVRIEGKLPGDQGYGL